MNFSVKSVVVALALSLGATMAPSASGAQTFYGGGDGGVVVVRDHGHRWHRGDRRYGSRVIQRHHGGDFRGARYYRGGPRYDRDRGYAGHRRYYRDSHRFGRTPYRTTAAW